MADIVNPYYTYFKDTTGSGASGNFYSSFGNIYTRTTGLRKGRGYFLHNHARRGFGFPAILGAIARFAGPVLKLLAPSLIGVAADVAKDAVAGKNVKEVAKDRVVNEAKHLLKQHGPQVASQLFNSQETSPAEEIQSPQHPPPAKLSKGRIVARKRKRFGWRGRGGKRRRSEKKYPALELMT